MLPSNALPVEKPDPQATREMPQIMLALGIEPALLKADHPALFAGMQGVCATCGSKETCNGDLSADTAASTFQDYCGNAATLTRLQDRADLSRD